MSNRKLALAAKPRRNTLVVVVLLSALTLVPAGQATDGRDFAGFYELSNVTDLGDTVRLTLTVRVFNYSDSDVTDAVVILSGNTDPEGNYGSFSGVALADRQSARLVGEFTIPKSEFTFWNDGGRPAMFIVYQGAAGENVRRTIELMLSSGEEQ